MNIFIIGCGRVGAALGRSRVACGDRVWGLRRSDPSKGNANIGEQPSLKSSHADIPFKVIYADEQQNGIQQLKDLIIQPDLICVCANPGIRGGGDNHILELVQSCIVAFPDAPYVYTSSTSVYADAPDSLVDEAGPFAASDNAQLLLAIEQAFSVLKQVWVLRLAAIVGPQRDHFRKRIAKAKDVFLVRGPLERRFNFIHERNVNDILNACIDELIPAGTYNVCAPIEMTLLDYINELMMEQRKKLPVAVHGEAMPDRIINNQKLISLSLPINWCRILAP